MADANSINISTREDGSNLKLIGRHAIIWTFLVGAEAASHLLFGGSWVIDMMVIVALIAWCAAQVSKQTGLSVQMTRPELREWVAAGMPSDIKQWRVDRKLSRIA